LDRLSDSTHFPTRRTILDAFESPVWARCDAETFAAKRAQFMTLTERLAGADFRTRISIQRDLDSVLEDCEVP